MDDGTGTGRCSDTRPLAHGLADYLAAARRPRGASPSLETSRLIADRDARGIAFPRPAGMRIADSYVAGLGVETPVRIYRPSSDGRQAAIVYFHGGGFTAGSIESYDCLAVALAQASAATVISVHYARLPESTPAATLDQCEGALDWVVRMADTLRIDPNRVAVAGDSAGAFLATQLALRVRRQGGPTLACQLLCYGAYDPSSVDEAGAASGDAVLTQSVIDAMAATYRACEARDNAPLPALLGSADLSDLPPAILLGAAYDPLLEQSRNYAARLREAGVVTQEHVAARMCHGFLRAIVFSPPARDEIRWLGAALRHHL